MKFSKAQKAAMTHGHLKDLTNRELADKFNVPYGEIYVIRREYKDHHENRQLELI